MENNQFDEIDEKILQMLAKDGNIPFQEVARACGVSDAEFLFSDAKYFFNAHLQPCNRLIHSILQSLTEGRKFVRGDRLGTAFLQRNQ